MWRREIQDYSSTSEKVGVQIKIKNLSRRQTDQFVTECLQVFLFPLFHCQVFFYYAHIEEDSQVTNNETLSSYKEKTFILSMGV